MRIGKPVEHVEQAVAATAVKDEFIRFCSVGKQLSYAGYLTYDALIFVRLLCYMLNHRNLSSPSLKTSPFLSFLFKTLL